MNHHLDAFLSQAQPAPLGPKAAREVERHLASCDECAERVANSEPHREALLHGIRLEPTLQADRNIAVEAAQGELATWARRALDRLGSNVRLKLDGALSSEQRSEIPRLVPMLDPAAFRMALAVSEAGLAVRSLVLRNERTVLRQDGRLALGRNGKQRDVPPEYVAARIAEHVTVPADVAVAMWTAIAGVAVDGGLGLPGLHSVDRNAGGSLLAVAESPSKAIRR
jgi:hypothetical protein